MPTQKILRTLHEVWDIAINELVAGTTVTITTGIAVDRDLSMSEGDGNRFLLHNHDLRAIYKEEVRMGSPVVSDPEITVNANGFVVVTLTCGGVPGDASSGELSVWNIHSATR